MEEDIMLVISEYANDLPDPLWFKSRRKHFDKAAYLNWAIEELVLYLESYGISIDSVSLFQRQMEDYAERSEKSGFMFSIASSVAMDILDTLNAIC